VPPHRCVSCRTRWPTLARGGSTGAGIRPSVVPAGSLKIGSGRSTTNVSVHGSTVRSALAVRGHRGGTVRQRSAAQRVRSTSLVVRRLDVRHRARRDLYGFRRRLPSHELVRNSSAVPGERRLLVRRGKRCAGRLRCGVGSEPAEQHYVVPAAEARDCPPRRLLCGEAGSLQRRAGGVAELGGHDDGWCVGLPGPGAKEVLTAGEPGASGTACSGHSRGSTGSDSRARTAKTGSWIRHSASRCTARSSASMPSAYSRAARERLCPRPRSRSLSRFSGSV